MTSPRLDLTMGITPQAAAKVLRDCADTAAAVPVTAGRAVSDLVSNYLQWAETTEGHLRWMTLQPEIVGMLQTERHWRIRQITEATPRPFPLVDAEVNLQAARLRALAGELEERVTRVAAASGQLAVLDTNVLLHYRPPDQLEWPALLGHQQVRLVVPLRVIEELDEKKYTARSDIADRARRLLPQLRTAIQPAGQPGQLRRGVTIEVPVEPGSRVRPANADEEVLSTCTELELVSGQPAVLITADTGMSLRGEARGLRVICPPDEWRRTMSADA